jgi:hypothetical protein
MASKILKGLAVAAGTGLAIGFGSKRHRQATSMTDSSDNILTIEPLLDRLDRVETRMSAMEARPTANIETIEARIERRFAELTREVPAMLESLLAPHVEDVRARLHAEMRESVQTALTAFEQTLDAKVSLRMATLEKALIDQSAVVTALSERALEAEDNFQRLIGAVERLCERKEQPAALNLPFERQLSEAFQRPPSPSALPRDSGFRPRIVKEEDDKPRHRKPLARL